MPEIRIIVHREGEVVAELNEPVVAAPAPVVADTLTEKPAAA